MVTSLTPTLKTNIEIFEAKFMFLKKYLLLIILILSANIFNAYAAEPIMITQSSNMDEVIFDGKWTSNKEWKRSSFNTFSYDDDSVIHLRSAHQGNFVYLMIDFVTDVHLEKDSDSAVVCFDTKNNKSTQSTINDYCFQVNLSGKQSFVYQGGSLTTINGNFEKITNPEDFIGLGNVSDENDKYSKTPHSSYEFKIPTDLVGRSNVYGFYVGVYDAHANRVYSWPEDILVDNPMQIPSPSKWGEIRSPDDTLPEFNLPILALFPSIIFVIYLTRFWKSF